MQTRQFLAVFFFLFSGTAVAQSPVLNKGDRLAIIGDSITEQKLYSKYIETYLLACHPGLEIHCFQFGWGGERAPGFAARMENDLVPWKPDVITTGYGMNDGSYRAYDEQIGRDHEVGMRQIIDRMKKAGATVVIGSPGVVDSFTWNRNNPDFDQVYNENLQQLGMIAEQLARENRFPYADVFGSMKSTMVAAKAALGEEYPLAGADGVHPGPNGHLVMAFAFLKALGLDGEIGTITIDISSDDAETTDGHKVLASKGGSVKMESTRYPFWFSGDERDPNGTISILPFVPFNQELNQFTLKVKHLTTATADVTFGSDTKTFSNEQLTEGINLAVEFPGNPFVEPFNLVLGEVAQKQAYETTMIKGLITNFRELDEPFARDDEVQEALTTIRRKMTELDDVWHANAKAAVQPIRYRIVVTPKT